MKVTRLLCFLFIFLMRDGSDSYYAEVTLPRRRGNKNRHPPGCLLFPRSRICELRAATLSIDYSYTLLYPFFLALWPVLPGKYSHWKSETSHNNLCPFVPPLADCVTWPLLCFTLSIQSCDYVCDCVCVSSAVSLLPQSHKDICWVSSRVSQVQNWPRETHLISQLKETASGGVDNNWTNVSLAGRAKVNPCLLQAKVCEWIMHLGASCIRQAHENGRERERVNCCK